MYVPPLSPKASNPSSFLENPQSLALKMKRRKSSRQLDHFVLSSTKIMNEFSMFKQELSRLEHSKVEYLQALQKICEINQRKSFCHGPLPEIQYFQEEPTAEKYRGRKEVNLIVQWQDKRRLGMEKYFENND